MPLLNEAIDGGKWNIEQWTFNKTLARKQGVTGKATFEVSVIDLDGKIIPGCRKAFTVQLQ